jgi:hypothetical protein
MEIVEVSASQYGEIIHSPYHVYGLASFNKLNENKAEDVFYLLFKEGKFRLGIIGGIRNNSFYSPFSAPFGGFTFLLEDIRIQYIEEALALLENWAKGHQFKSIHIILPPTIYNESFIAKQVNCLFRKNYELNVVDLNYSFELKRFSETYTDTIWRNARKNLRIAFTHTLVFKKCESNEDKKVAYDIIQANRESKGFPLRMSWSQVYETSQVVEADFFLVYDEQLISIASAIVFHVNIAIVQVIYWGDLPEHATLKTMNFLSYKIFEYYHAMNKDVVDIGPSTETSLPNYGLCEFKESIGCDIQTKLCFSIKI